MGTGRIVLLCSGAALLVGASGPPKSAPVVKRIQALESEFARMANAGDALGISKTYAKDAIVLPPGAPRLNGREAALSYWTVGLQQVTAVRLNTVDVRPLSATTVEEFGSYQMRTKGVPAKQMSGKYVVVWQKEGASWLIGTDIWNAD